MLKRLAAVSAAVLSVSVLAACGTENGSTATDTPASPDPTSEAPDGSCDYPADGSEPAKEVSAPPAEPAASGKIKMTITTSVGTIDATLDADKAPCTVNNFISLADQGYFDGTTCHRLTTQSIFVLQCGDPTATGMGGPGYTIADEFDPNGTYGPGTLAMAKTTYPDSGGSQFFMVYDGADDQLPPQYTVFGTFSEAGVEILQGVAAQGTDTGAPDGAPKQPVDIESVTSAD